MILFTQTVRDAGCELRGLTPLGYVRIPLWGYCDYVGRCKHDSSRGDEVRVKRDMTIAEQCTVIRPDIDYLFNVKVTFSYSGHPSNGDYNVLVEGDGYSARPEVGLKELRDNDEVGKAGVELRSRRGDDDTTDPQPRGRGTAQELSEKPPPRRRRSSAEDNSKAWDLS